MTNASKRLPLRIKIPFDDLQVEKLNKYQDNPNWHPYTCHNSHTLIADKNGLHCWSCNYHQDWCYAFSIELSTVNYINKSALL